MCTVWSYTKYDGNLQDLCTMVIEISSFFLLLQKNENGISDISVSRCTSKPSFLLLHMCDLSYFDIVLCPSSSQIPETPLTLTSVDESVEGAKAGAVGSELVGVKSYQ